jgi:hypothetical protein
MKEIDDPSLRVYVIWLPMLPSDDSEDAVEASREWVDSRVTYYWEPERTTGKKWAQTLGLGRMGALFRSLGFSRVAWDVYLVFPRGQRWRDPAPEPLYWTHQLGGAFELTPSLDADTLVDRTRVILSAQNNYGK